MKQHGFQPTSRARERAAAFKRQPDLGRGREKRQESLALLRRNARVGLMQKRRWVRRHSPVCQPPGWDASPSLKRQCALYASTVSYLSVSRSPTTFQRRDAKVFTLPCV
jgi:hypothetical protein